MPMKPTQDPVTHGIVSNDVIASSHMEPTQDLGVRGLEVKRLGDFGPFQQKGDKLSHTVDGKKTCTTWDV